MSALNLRSVLQFPLIRMIIGAGICVGLVILVNTVTEDWLPLFPSRPDLANLSSALLTCLVVFFAYSLLYRAYEKRKISELFGRLQPLHILRGLLFGAGLVALVFGVMFLTKSFTVSVRQPAENMLPAFSDAIMAGIVGEIVLRGIVFRILEEWIGSVFALCISALFFFTAHGLNPNLSWPAAIGVMFEAGLLIPALYIYTRSLWVPICFHFAWDFFPPGLFNAPNSGTVFNRSLYLTHISGSSWFTGGSFGPKASIQAILLFAFCAIFLIKKCAGENKMLAPSWKRGNGS